MIMKYDYNDGEYDEEGYDVGYNGEYDEVYDDEVYVGVWRWSV